MYKMVIADDEALVCQYLHHVIEQNHLPFDICGEATNGQAAIQLVDKYDPEFVLLDINMPIVTGLEAAKQIRKKHPDTIIYILTAYRQFDYIQDAMHAAVFDYLLKPIKSSDLVDALKKGMAHALKHRIHNLQQHRLEEKITENYPLVVKQQLFELLKNGHGSTQDLRILRNISHNKNFTPQIIVSIGYWNSLDTKKDRLEKQIIQEYFQAFSDIAIIVPRGGEIVLICSAWDSQWQQHLQQQLLDCEQTYLLTFCAGIAAMDDPSQISTTYRNARKKREWGLFWRYHQNSADSLVIDMDTEINESNANINSAIKKMEKELLANEVSLAKESLQLLFKHLQHDFYPTEFVRTTSARIACNCIDRCSEYTLSENEIDVLQKKSINQIKDIKDAKEIENFLISLFNQLTDHSEARQNNAEKTVTWAVAYIDRNYEKEITLEQIAGELFVSSGYLCRIFKKYTGKRYAAYLTDVRMQKAKELLCREKFTVTEVARMVGFNDASYFSSVFKKYYKQAPSKIIEST